MRKARRNDAVTLMLSPILETMRRAQLHLGTVSTAAVKKLSELVEGLPEKAVDGIRRDTNESCYMQITLGAWDVLTAKWDAPSLQLSLMLGSLGESVLSESQILVAKNMEAAVIYGVPLSMGLEAMVKEMISANPESKLQGNVYRPCR